MSGTWMMVAGFGAACLVHWLAGVQRRALRAQRVLEEAIALAMRTGLGE